MPVHTLTLCAVKHNICMISCVHGNAALADLLTAAAADPSAAWYLIRDAVALIQCIHFVQYDGSAS